MGIVIRWMDLYVQTTIVLEGSEGSQLNLAVQLNIYNNGIALATSEIPQPLSYIIINMIHGW